MKNVKEFMNKKCNTTCIYYSPLKNNLGECAISFKDDDDPLDGLVSFNMDCQMPYVIELYGQKAITSRTEELINGLQNEILLLKDDLVLAILNTNLLSDETRVSFVCNKINEDDLINHFRYICQVG